MHQVQVGLAQRVALPIRPDGNAVRLVGRGQIVVDVRAGTGARRAGARGQAVGVRTSIRQEDQDLEDGDAVDLNPIAIDHVVRAIGHPEAERRVAIPSGIAVGVDRGVDCGRIRRAELKVPGEASRDAVTVVAVPVGREANLVQATGPDAAVVVECGDEVVGCVLGPSETRLAVSDEVHAA